jgi:uridine kinase
MELLVTRGFGLTERVISDVLNIVSETLAVYPVNARLCRETLTDQRLPPRRLGTVSGRQAPAAARPVRLVRVSGVREVTKAVGRWQAERTTAAAPLVVAIDGPGASGKSTIARALAAATPTALVHTDDFFLPSAGPAEGRKCLDEYYDWRRLRAEALVPLLAGHAAGFRQFHWKHGVLDGATTVAPAGLIVLEGVFSASPELSDLVDRAVFVETAEPERRRRLRRQITPEEWDDHWLTAERAYFDGTRPPSSFDLIVPGTGPADSAGTA